MSRTPLLPGSSFPSLQDGGAGTDGNRQRQAPEADPVVQESRDGAAAGEADNAAQQEMMISSQVRISKVNMKSYLLSEF
jgi:hypothetical protein